MENVFYIIGFPSLYGGEGAELYHQVRVWEKLGIKLHFLPMQKNVRQKLMPRFRVINDDLFANC